MTEPVRNTWYLGALIAALSALFSIPSAAQEGTAPPGPDAEQQAMMEAWENAARTGEAHAMLADHTGTWRASMEMWMDPAGPPVETTYEVTRTMELDGRVLREEWAGDFMGQPFRGIGRTGYDNVTEKFWATWTDNMSTGLLTMHGARDPDGSVRMTGAYRDPASGEEIPSRSVWSFPDADTERMESFETRGGQEFMNMRVTLVRNED